MLSVGRVNGFKLDFRINFASSTYNQRNKKAGTLPYKKYYWIFAGEEVSYLTILCAFTSSVVVYCLFLAPVDPAAPLVGHAAKGGEPTEALCTRNK